MTYWVYEDYPTNRARVHMVTCNRCNHGRGMKGSRLPDNRWHGPFETEREAIDRALSTGRLDARGTGSVSEVWEVFGSGHRIASVTQRILLALTGAHQR